MNLGPLEEEQSLQSILRILISVILLNKEGNTYPDGKEKSWDRQLPLPSSMCFINVF